MARSNNFKPPKGDHKPQAKGPRRMGAGRSVLNSLWKACSWEAWNIYTPEDYCTGPTYPKKQQMFDVLNLLPQLLPVSPYPSHLCTSLVSNPRNLIGLHAILAVGVYDPRTPWWPNVAMDLRAVTAPNTNRQIWGSLLKEEFLMDAYWGVKNLRSFCLVSFHLLPLHPRHFEKPLKAPRRAMQASIALSGCPRQFVAQAHA